MPTFTIIQQICIWALPVLFAITLHEAAHAYVANLCGDTTAKMLGRMSLNPIKHIDPMGTVLLPIVIGFLTQFSFLIGYAKPVPINWNHLKSPNKDMVLVALAGPFANFFMAFLWALCFKIVFVLNLHMSSAALFIIMTSKAGVSINLALAFLNLLPIPPLDGSRVISALLPKKQALAYAKVEPYGFFILILLLATNVLTQLLTPLMNAGSQFLAFIFQL